MRFVCSVLNELKPISLCVFVCDFHIVRETIAGFFGTQIG